MTLLDRLGEVKEQQRSSSLQEEAWQQFLKCGLPTKKHEQYRYLKLRDLYERPYSLNSIETPPFSKIESHILPECKERCLVFINGSFCREYSTSEGIDVQSLQEGYQTYGSFLQSQGRQEIKKERDPFLLLSGALNRDGIFLYISPNQTIESPIQILHFSDGSGLSFPCIHLFAGKQARATVVTTQAGENRGLINQSEHLYLEEGADISLIQSAPNHSSSGWLFEGLRAQLKKESRLNVISASNGAKTVRYDYKVALNGENASASLQGAWILTEQREAHVNVLIEHNAPETHSNQLFKGILYDHSRSSFEGKLLVDSIAQKTEAYQLNNNLLLSDHALAYSKPNLEIFADDVKASHGATVGQLDADGLFYLRSRGVTEKEAATLLTQGFYQEVTNQIPIESLRRQWQ
ncbi:MAG: Fe-S cluster assembly protein SufD [Waddliaceae bacterium]